MENTTTEPTKADTLRQLAAEVRQNPTAREAIAAGFELIAGELDACEDCGAKGLGADAPDVGADAGLGGTD